MLSYCIFETWLTLFDFVHSLFSFLNKPHHLTATLLYHFFSYHVETTAIRSCNSTNVSNSPISPSLPRSDMSRGDRRVWSRHGLLRTFRIKVSHPHPPLSDVIYTLLFATSFPNKGTIHRSYRAFCSFFYWFTIFYCIRLITYFSVS